jgi:hypothetical protein
MQSTINLTKGIPFRQLFLPTVFIVCLVSCTNTKRPEGILSERQFSALLVEMYIAEARVGTFSISRDSAIKLFKPFEESYYKKNNLSADVLKQTYRYYLDHPNEFEKVYDSVMDTLNLREKRAQQKASPTSTATPRPENK